jgi:hypothetical protein
MAFDDLDFETCLSRAEAALDDADDAEARAIDPNELDTDRALAWAAMGAYSCYATAYLTLAEIKRARTG